MGVVYSAYDDRLGRSIRDQSDHTPCVVHLKDAGRQARPAEAGRTAARTLCNLSLRTASGPEGSSAKQILTCAAGSPGRGSVRLDECGLEIDDCGLI